MAIGLCHRPVQMLEFLTTRRYSSITNQKTSAGADYYEQRYRERMVKSLQKKAQALGMELVAQPLVETIS